MTLIETLTENNDEFAQQRFSPELKIIPTLKIMIVGCVDPRVDPSAILGLADGDAAVIRNVGGRCTPSLIETMAMLRRVSQSAGGELGPGWTLIVLHHTDCGITRLTDSPDLLASYFRVDEAALDTFAVTDPYTSVKIDIEALRADDRISGALQVAGLVYDVATGRLETVVDAAVLRPE